MLQELQTLYQEQQHTQTQIKGGGEAGELNERIEVEASALVVS